MIRVFVGNETFAISFKHEIYQEVVDGKVRDVPRYIGGRWMKGKTVCMILTGSKENPIEVGRATAFCSEDDNFNKELGRKLSLTRVLGIYFPSPEVRTHFWKAYHARKPQ